MPANSYVQHASTTIITDPSTNEKEDPLRDDASVFSNDGYEFGVIRLIVELGCPGFKFPLDVHPGEDAAGRPALKLPEDAEVVLALLSAIYPVPMPPITSLELAERSVNAAHKYGIDRSLLTLDNEIFKPDQVVPDPLRMCSLAWRAERWHQFEMASRYALAESKLWEEAFGWALDTTDGGDAEVMSALALTQMGRERCMDTVVDALPVDLICANCRSIGRPIAEHLKNIVREVFKSTYPDPYALFYLPTWSTSDLVRNCPTNTCLTTIESYRFSGTQVVVIGSAMENVHQTVEKIYVEEKIGRTRKGMDQV